MNVLQVGTIEPSLADAITAKYPVLQLPNDATRADFLAEHGRSVVAIVDSGPPGVDAEVMEALRRTGSALESATPPTCSTTLLPTQPSA